MSGELAAAYVTGLQGHHPRYVIANAGCKHFDVYAGPENIPVQRHVFNAEVKFQMNILIRLIICYFDGIVVVNVVVAVVVVAVVIFVAVVFVT